MNTENTKLVRVEKIHTEHVRDFLWTAWVNEAGLPFEVKNFVGRGKTEAEAIGNLVQRAAWGGFKIAEKEELTLQQAKDALREKVRMHRRPDRFIFDDSPRNWTCRMLRELFPGASYMDCYTLSEKATLELLKEQEAERKAAECQHDECRTIDHPDGSGGQVPYCPSCDEVISL